MLDRFLAGVAEQPVVARHKTERFLTELLRPKIKIYVLP
jgi:hypothetical protein